MSLRLYISIISVSTLLFWVIFVMIINIIDPQITSWLGFFLFYVSLFLAITGTASIVGFVVRFVGLKHELAVNSVQTAFRQSFLFATLVVVALALLAVNLFTWVNLILLILALSILEYFLLSYTSDGAEQGKCDSENCQGENEKNTNNLDKRVNYL